ncbi:MAG TPA: helix-turn-helix transcriptional regulator [Cyanophyceae cyanobacterium]
MKELRERANLRTVDVASIVGVSDMTIRNWESGKTIPKLRLDQFVVLCRTYKCSIEELNKASIESQKEN